ncbi:P-loop NTPase fold protein [Rugosimonospora africana]|uniref:KAP NTPase domain-containing protein n=1 Tax=Rugosimonospora africana TaxID=556532 RepID=A0A8J3QP81_9ACTN|nr:P-loop NTPase fold protein [Rugosimonospora africana]GIH12968.1 hypothetical protein Raf01_11400 [Rugosimonospora africana]
MSGPAAATPWVPARRGGVGGLESWQAIDGGMRLASSGTDGVVQVWDLSAGTLTRLTAFSHGAGVQHLRACRGDAGVRLVSAGVDEWIRVWDLESGTEVASMSPVNESWIHAMSSWTTTDGESRLAAAGSDGSIRIWDVESGALVSERIAAHTGALHALTTWVAADGTRRLCSAGQDTAIRIWGEGSGDLLREISGGHARAIWSLTNWPDAGGGMRVASGSADGTVRIWDAETGTPIGSPLLGHTGWVHTIVTWSTGDQVDRLASASMDGTVRIWDPRTGDPLAGPVPGNFTSAESGMTAWSTGGRNRLATSARDGIIHIWDADTGTPVDSSPTTHMAALWALATWTASDGHTHVAAAGDDGVLCVWDTETGAQVGQPLSGHTATVWTMTAFTAADGRALIASAGDDGTVRCWDAHFGAAAGEPINAHAGWIPALIAHPATGGPVRLISGGADGTIRLWDPATGRAQQVPNVAVTGLNWVLALAAWSAEDGRVRIAFGGDGNEIHVYDAGTGAPFFGPLSGHAGWIRALATWTDRNDRRLLASGSVDGTIRVWDAGTGEPVGTPLHGHIGTVRSLVPWTDPQGNPRLASAGGDDGTIRLWDPENGTPIGEPLTGHQRGVWDLAGWRAADGSARLASTGYDGTIRLWDLHLRRAIRSIEVGPVGIWALSDAPATVDLLDRQRWADAIADQLVRPGQPSGSGQPSTSDDPADDGPSVVSVEGPWGCGKTTLMRLVRRRLDERHPPPARADHRSAARQRYTVRAALREITRHGRAPAQPAQPRPATGPARRVGRRATNRTSRPGGATAHRGVLTVWFNPWVHQSGEQAWAGLAHEIIERAGTVLYPTDSERERYWFRRNLGRSDRYSLRRALYRRVVSPMLGVALGAIVAPLAIALAELNVPFDVLGHSVTAATIALVISAACLVAGIAHTTTRFWFSPAAHYLPAALFHGPVTDADLLQQDNQPLEIVADPLRRARVGALYLYQHDIGEVITDVRNAGCDLVVFVDDIDRCRTTVTAEVFEAINLFLSGVNADTGLRCRFVIGLDPEVIAAHLDGHYPDHYHRQTAQRGDDPSAGWAFLRKLIQLPVVLPQAADDSIPRFIDQAAGSARTSADGSRVPAPRGAKVSAAGASAVGASTAGGSVAGGSVAGGSVAGGSVAGGSVTGAAGGAAADGARGDGARPSPGTAPTPVDTLAWRSLEQHPQVRSWLTARLSAQPGRSVRNAKRLINVWQFYARVCPEPSRSPDDGPADVRASISHAKHLLIFAEIVTRWPALLHALQWRSDGRAGLDRLVAYLADEDRWNQTVGELGIEVNRYEHQLRELRLLLLQCDPGLIGNLADTLL